MPGSLGGPEAGRRAFKPLPMVEKALDPKPLKPEPLNPEPLKPEHLKP